MPSAPTDVLRVLLVTGEHVAPDALRPAAATLQNFGVSAEVLTMADLGREGWDIGACALIVASAEAATPARLARQTALPVVRVPVPASGIAAFALLWDETDNLPAPPEDGEPFATVAIGEAGAKNAALFVVSLLALDDPRLRAAWEAFRVAQTDAVLRQPAPTLD